MLKADDNEWHYPLTESQICSQRTKTIPVVTRRGCDPCGTLSFPSEYGQFDDILSPLVERTLRRRGLSNFSIYLAFTNQVATGMRAILIPPNQLGLGRSVSRHERQVERCKTSNKSRRTSSQELCMHLILCRHRAPVPSHLIHNLLLPGKSRVLSRPWAESLLQHHVFNPKGVNLVFDYYSLVHLY